MRKIKNGLGADWIQVPEHSNKIREKTKKGHN